MKGEQMREVDPRERLQPAQIRLIILTMLRAVWCVTRLFAKATFWVMDDPWADVTGDICWNTSLTSDHWEFHLWHRSPPTTLSTGNRRRVHLHGKKRRKKKITVWIRAENVRQLHGREESGCRKDSRGKVTFDWKRRQSLFVFPRQTDLWDITNSSAVSKVCCGCNHI